ncbi:hypothetical protein XENOCAPTIV_016061, partial [Xenoophorus captivus]
IILVSLSLIILPSFSPFSRRLSADDDYRTTGGWCGAAVVLEPPGSFENPAADDEGPEMGQSENVTAAVAEQTDVMDRRGGLDSGKPAHADEM